MASARHLTPADVRTARAGLRGSLLLPGDAGYDEARMGFNLRFDQRPAAIVTARDAGDVAAAVRLAADRELPLAVQATGHGIVVAADGAVLLRTGEMDGIAVDAGTRTARVQAGALAGALQASAEAAGLCAPVGYSDGVGVVGYALGGGHGWLARRHGLAVDGIRSAELVGAGGERVRVDEVRDPELLWGLRGGCGNFGVVTELELDLFPAGAMTGGRLWWPAERAPEVLAAWAGVVAGAEDGVTLNPGLLQVPPLPEVPEPLRGRPFVTVDVHVMGDMDAALPVLEPLRAVDGLALDGVRPLRPTELSLITSDPTEPSPHAGWGLLVGNLPGEALDALTALVGASVGGPLTALQVRHLGGAIARADPGATAVGQRDAAYLVYTLAMVPTPAALEPAMAAMAGVARALAPWMLEHVWPNVRADNPVGVEGVYDAPTLRRLRALKARVDPANRFRANVNVTPA